MTPSIANHLNDLQVQALLASAPPASGARLRALSIEKSSDSARKQLCSGLATLCQMEVQLVGGQRLDQATARELHGLMISLHGKVDGLLKLNSGGLWVDGEHEERGDRGRTSARRQRARRDDEEDEDDDDHHRRAAADPARTSARASAGAHASASDHASPRGPRRSAYPGGPVPQGPPPPPRESLFQMYTPAPPPPAPPPNFDRARVIPARGIQIGAVACADPGVEPVQGAVIGIYEPAGYPWYLALNLNEPLAIAVFGAPGGGKTYLLRIPVEVKAAA